MEEEFLKESFTLIKGFDNIEEIRKAIKLKFPQIDYEEFDIYEVQGMLYAVTMHGIKYEIVISREYIKFRIFGYPQKAGCIKFIDFKTTDWKWPGIDGGSSHWDDKINTDAVKVFGPEIVVHGGEMVKGVRRKHWGNNTKVLLNCLFANKTRFDDNAYY